MSFTRNLEIFSIFRTIERAPSVLGPGKNGPPSTKRAQSVRGPGLEGAGTGLDRPPKDIYIFSLIQNYYYLCRIWVKDSP